MHAVAMLQSMGAQAALLLHHPSRGLMEEASKQPSMLRGHLHTDACVQEVSAEYEVKGAEMRSCVPCLASPAGRLCLAPH